MPDLLTVVEFLKSTVHQGTEGQHAEKVVLVLALDAWLAFEVLAVAKIRKGNSIVEILPISARQVQVKIVPPVPCQ